MKFCDEFIYRWLLAPALLLVSSYLTLAGPIIEVDKKQIELGKIYAGNYFPGTIQKISIKNTGDSNLVVYDGKLNVSGEYTRFPGQFTLLPGGSKEVDVTLYIIQLGIQSRTLTISSNDPSSPSLALPLTYEGIVQPPLIVQELDGTALVSGVSVVQCDPTVYDPDRIYPTALPKSAVRTLRLKNSGEGYLPVYSNYVHAHEYPYGSEGDDIEGKSMMDSMIDTWVPSYIPPLGSVDVSFRIYPQSVGTIVSQITLSTDWNSRYIYRTKNLFQFFVSTEASGIPRFFVSKNDYGNNWDPEVKVPVQFDTVHLGEWQDVPIYIDNQGFAPLTIHAEILGGNKEDFVLPNEFPITILPNRSVYNMVKVRFRPTDGGPRVSTLRLYSNDPDQPQFDLPLSGQGFRLVLEDPEGSNFGSVPVGGLASRTFALENKGDTAISGISVDLTSTLSGQLSLIGEVPFRLEPGERSEFVVRFAPQQMSSFSSYIVVTTLENLTKPLLLGMSARGVDAPALVLSSERGQISAPGETTMEVPYDSVDIGDYKRFAFDLKNQGTQPLALSADFRSGSNEDFSLLSPLPDLVEPGGRIRFEITFRPKQAGNKEAVFRIRSNDPDQQVFDIQLTGFGFPFSVETPEGTDFNSTEVGESEVLDFVLVNNGSEPLEEITAAVLTESLVKASADLSTALAAYEKEFTLITPVPRRLGAKERFRFQVMFKPRTSGDRSVVLRVQSTNNRKRSLEIQIRGRGKMPGPRDIVIRNAQGDNLRSEGEFFGFGRVEVGSKANRWFSIRNKTVKPLIVSRISIAGLDADQFRIAGALNKEIPAGGVLRVHATCTPSAKGEFEASFVVRCLYNGVSLPSIRIFARGNAVAATSGALVATKALVSQAYGSADKEIDAEESEASVGRIVHSTTWIKGLAYNTVTVMSPMAGGKTPVVEVSSDSIDWHDGERYTKVVESVPDRLVVRDLLPSDNGARRYLRVRLMEQE